MSNQDKIDSLEKELLILNIDKIRGLLNGSGMTSTEFLSPLANILVKECQTLGMDKDYFLSLMSEGWDYHQK